MAQSAWEVTIKQNTNDCGTMRVAVKPFLISGADECEAKCNTGSRLMETFDRGSTLHNLGISLKNDRKYYYDLTVYIHKLGPERHGVYFS